jgi:hypothetical protein
MTLIKMSPRSEKSGQDEKPETIIVVKPVPSTAGIMKNGEGW